MNNRKNGSNKNIAIGIYTICIAVVIAFAISNMHVLKTAGDIANNVRIDVEQDLIRNEIDRQVEILARDQSQISHWDKTVIALGSKIDQNFVQTEMADWLWDDFGVQTSIIVSPNGKPLVTVFQDEVLAANEGAAGVSLNIDLIEDARLKYMENRKDTGTGFVVTEDPVRSERPIYSADIRAFNGQIGIVIAQAIIPDDEAVLPSGLPQVLLTFKPFSETTFADIGEKLGLTAFQIASANDMRDSFSGMVVSNGTRQPVLRAMWKASSPSDTIWSQSVPILLVLLLMVTLAVGLIAFRFGRALRELQTSEAKNRFLALHDALTGLPNRLQFDSALDDIISAGKQDRCAILCADLDRFKAVNDTYGHQAGDTVIKTVANRIADAVGDKGMAARIGGDEFIMLLHDELDRDSVLFLCDTMIEKICEDISFDGGIASVGASIGVAWWPDDALTAKTIIRSADEALYRAKENGRGRTHSAGDLVQNPVNSDNVVALHQAQNQ